MLRRKHSRRTVWRTTGIGVVLLIALVVFRDDLFGGFFVAAWLAWNTFAPQQWQFDPRELNYTLLTLILSLQASYAAPLILLAQNRQTDRDRVALEQDRGRDERNLADTEFLTREVAALRIALRDTATRDFIRSELRDLLEDLQDRGVAGPPARPDGRTKPAKSAKPAGSGGPRGIPT